MAKRRSRLALTAAAVVLTGGAASAQVPPEPSPGEQPSPTGSAAPDEGIADIIVTANRRDERQRDVANSVTAISGEDLTRRNEIRLQDLIGQVPGLSIEDTSPTLSRIIIRGINAGGVGTTVGSVVDDVPTSVSNAQNNGAIETPNFDTYDLQRIEVLRGPQGTLYGATAEGGLIKYVTNPPEMNKFYGSVETGVDGLTGGGIGGTLKGFVNIPLIDDKAALRISATNEWIPGYIKDAQTGRDDTNSAQQYSFRGSLLAKPIEGLTVRLTAERQSTFADNANLVQVEGAAVTPATPPGNQLSLVDGLSNSSAFRATSHNETAVYYADVNYDLNFANVTSLTSYVLGDFQYLNDFTNQNVAPGTPYAALLGQIYKLPSALFPVPENLHNGKFNQEVRLSSDPGSEISGHGFDWQFGGFYTHEVSSLSQLYNILDPATFALQSPAGGEALDYASLSEWAVFGQVTFHITPTVELDLGGRLAGIDQHSASVNRSGVLTTGGAPTSYASPVFSNDHVGLYSVAPKWHIDPDTLVYGRIATGYRPGGPNFPAFGFTFPNYTPDRTVNYEVGVRRDFFDKKVTADVTGFIVHWKSIQVLSSIDVPGLGPVNYNGNAGSATSKGVEWSLGWQVLPGLRATAEGAYTDARLTADAPSLGGSNGQYLPYVPDVSTGVNIDYSWSAFRDYEAFVSGTWTYVGERFTSFSGSPVLTSHVALPSYNTGSLRAGVENDRYGAEIFVNNISDERGITTYSNQGGANQTGQITLIEPRLIGATLRMKF